MMGRDQGAKESNASHAVYEARARHMSLRVIGNVIGFAFFLVAAGLLARWSTQSDWFAGAIIVVITAGFFFAFYALGVRPYWVQFFDDGHLEFRAILRTWRIDGSRVTEVRGGRDNEGDSMALTFVHDRGSVSTLELRGDKRLVELLQRRYPNIRVRGSW
jgi:hypothetical protein